MNEEKCVNLSIFVYSIKSHSLLTTLEISIKREYTKKWWKFCFKSVEVLRTVKTSPLQCLFRWNVSPSKSVRKFNIQILPADRGNNTVVLDTKNNNSIITAPLKDGFNYSLIRDPTPKIERKITSLIKSLRVLPETQKCLISKESNPPSV